MSTELDKQAEDFCYPKVEAWFSDGGDFRPTAEMCSEIAAAFASQVREQSKWVSVNESLPERGQMVLIHEGAHKDSTSMGWLVHDPESGKEWQSTETAPQDEPIYFSLDQITHWQPLPAPPQTTEQEER